METPDDSRNFRVAFASVGRVLLYLLHYSAEFAHLSFLQSTSVVQANLLHLV